ncbi:MAG TPA: methylmalonyl-CoA epimerase [Desulfatiglandales bacterium]|nr:methylmalonyl-CoA epimerase [Desulfatiglandales bacterium]
MKIKSIDHIGIAVETIESGKRLFSDILGLKLEKIETIEEQKVTTAFFPVAEVELELLESTEPNSPVSRFIQARGEGVQHIAFRVENIDEALQELKDKGIRLIDQEPRKGAGGARIAFIHPKETHGVLVELCEK